MNWKTTAGSTLLALAFTALLTTGVHAQTTCSGTLSGTFNNDIVVNGGACTLQGAIVNGSVLVSNNGTLTAAGGTQISGSVQADGAGNITINNATVLGDVSLNNSQNVTVGTAATLGVLNLNNSGTITARGAINNLLSHQWCDHCGRRECAARQR
jgi:hypothetical protein